MAYFSNMITFRQFYCRENDQKRRFSASYHDFPQPGTRDFTELCISFVIQNRPAEPEAGKWTLLQRFWTTGANKRPGGVPLYLYDSLNRVGFNLSNRKCVTM